MSKPRSRARVETVVFDEPSAPREMRRARKRQRDAEAGHAEEAGGAEEDRGARRAEAALARKKARLEREATYQDVQELGASGMSKRDRKAYEAAKLAKLGCKPEKAPKVPLKILFSRDKTLAARAKKQQEEIEASGIVTGRERKKRRQTASKEKKRYDDLHHWNKGSFHGGVLKIFKEP